MTMMCLTEVNIPSSMSLLCIVSPSFHILIVKIALFSEIAVEILLFLYVLYTFLSQRNDKCLIDDIVNLLCELQICFAVWCVECELPEYYSCLNEGENTCNYIVCCFDKVMQVEQSDRCESC